MMEKMIEVKNLVKYYDKVVAVDDISFKVYEGQLFAFLGPNGAGKSTTIKMISTLLKKTSGEISINNFKIDEDDDRIRESIGIIFQESILDHKLTVYENLKLRATFYKIPNNIIKARINEISKIVQIENLLNRKYGDLSGGQRRRVDIARALLNEPRLLILDEPTTGLDPQSRLKLWETIKYLQKEKKVTVFLTTHYMEEAAEADYVVIIDQGKIVSEGTPFELKDRYSSDKLRLAFNKQYLHDITTYLDDNKFSYQVINDVINIIIKDSLLGLTILKALESYIVGFELVKGTMDDVFVNVTGRVLEEGGEF